MNDPGGAIGFGESSMRCIVGLLSLMLTCVALSTLAVAATSIEGSWIGSGTVSHRGNVDRVQCRVRYTKSSKNSYATSSVCTTENGRYDVKIFGLRTSADRSFIESSKALRNIYFSQVSPDNEYYNLNDIRYFNSNDFWNLDWE